jgi:hypothetical protein
MDQAVIDDLSSIAQRRVQKRLDQVNSLIYRRGPRSAPPGFDNLDTPEKRATVTRYLERQAQREARDQVAGNLSETLVQHPAVREMAQQDMQEVP